MIRLGKILIGAVLVGMPLGVQAQAPDADVGGVPLPNGEVEVSEIGLPFQSEHFAPQEYRQYPQNWAVTQDARGLIYVANNDGILEYDGESWRLIPTVTNTFVRSLTTAGDGTVYAGVVGDFGYLEPDSTGLMHYRSLFEEIPDEHHSFSDVWGTHSTRDGVYFQTNERLFRWNGTDMKVWASSEEGFHTSFVVRDELYVRDFQRGLLKMEEDSLQRVPGGGRIREMPVHMMVPFPDDQILVGTHKDGLFLYDGDSFTRFATEAQPFLDEYGLYHGCLLSGGHVALATIGGGVLVIDREGRLMRVLDQSAELPEGVVNHVYEDREGGLWMALNSSGIARAAVESALSQYDKRLGLEGLIYKIDRYQDRLYVATGSGLFVLQERPLNIPTRQRRERTAFRRVEDIPTSWDLESTEEGLLVATESELYLVQGERVDELTLGPPRHTARTVRISKQFKNWFFVGGRQGVTALLRQEKNWEAYPIPGISEEIHAIVEGGNRTLWLSTAQGDVLRAKFLHSPSSSPTVERFEANKALSKGFNRVGIIGEDMVLLSRERVYLVEESSLQGNPAPNGEEISFIRDTRFDVGGNDGPFLSLVEDAKGDVWMLRGDRAYVGRKQQDETYAWEEIPELRFPKAEITQMYVDKDDVLWIGNGGELIRYDPRQARSRDASFPVYVRQVTALRNQRVLYGGAHPGEAVAPDAFTWTRIHYDDNDLRFDYAAPRFGNLSPIEYQYRLDGVDSDWSDWQSKKSVVYSNLTEGDYTFHVRAREGEEVVSREATLRFAVLPPWYRTWWAYSAYLLAIVLMGVAYRRYHQIVQENERAKEQAKELERERLANERLQEANERLRQANELKDNFLANTSHELRTPLTTILGFTDVLKEEAPAHHQEFLGIIEKSGHRLLRTLNALLDLAKLRSGVVEAQLRRVDVVATTKDVLEMVQHEAETKNIRLELQTSEQPIYARLDDRYYEQILDNLLSNALKFTDEGSIQVEINREGEWVCVHVRDTGAGIDDTFLPYLFDDFKQESSGLDRDHEGNGLGLAITARLVELMHGTIEVDSTKGVGSTFTVRFPGASVPEQGTASAPAETVHSEQPTE